MPLVCGYYKDIFLFSSTVTPLKNLGVKDTFSMEDDKIMYIDNGVVMKVEAFTPAPVQYTNYIYNDRYWDRGIYDCYDPWDKYDNEYLDPDDFHTAGYKKPEKIVMLNKHPYRYDKYLMSWVSAEKQYKEEVYEYDYETNNFKAGTRVLEKVAIKG
jgi:hypothetical protein